MRAERILILGGTGEARALASKLVAAGFPVVTSLAGVTEHPLLPEGDVRRGGFGGVDGLVQYLGEQRIALVADATHPFAAQMSVQAHQACAIAGVPLFRLERPAWTPQDGDRWIAVSSIAEAAAAVPDGARVLLTIGRKEIAPFLAREEIGGIARMIEPPQLEVPARWAVLLERPPFTVESETALMQRHRITHLVTKNAGGPETKAKLSAARQLHLPVLIISRPVKPDVPRFATASDLVRAFTRLLSP